MDVEIRAEVVFRGVRQVFGQFIRSAPKHGFFQPEFVVRHDADHGHVVAEAETVPMGEFAEIAAADGFWLAVVPDAIGTGVDDAPFASLVNQVGVVGAEIAIFVGQWPVVIHGATKPSAMDSKNRRGGLAEVRRLLADQVQAQGHCPLLQGPPGWGARSVELPTSKIPNRRRKKMAERHIFKVVFVHQGKVWEIFAKKVSQGAMFGFIEVEQLLFGERTTLLVDPGEERIKSEFEGVKRTYIPLQSVLRIDEVNARAAAQGVSKISTLEGGNVASFPMPFMPPPGSPPGGDRKN